MCLYFQHILFLIRKIFSKIWTTQIVQLPKGTSKNWDNWMAFFSNWLGFNKNWAGKRGISLLSFKTSNILQRGFKPCFNKILKFWGNPIKLKQIKKKSEYWTFLVFESRSSVLYLHDLEFRSWMSHCCCPLQSYFS